MTFLRSGLLLWNIFLFWEIFNGIWKAVGLIYWQVMTVASYFCISHGNSLFEFLIRNYSNGNICNRGEPPVSDTVTSDKLQAIDDFYAIISINTKYFIASTGWISNGRTGCIFLGRTSVDACRCCKLVQQSCWTC